MNIMERKNTELIKEFNRYVREYPQFSENIPDNALVVMQLEGDVCIRDRAHIISLTSILKMSIIVLKMRTIC